MTTKFSPSLLPLVFPLLLALPACQKADAEPQVKEVRAKVDTSVVATRKVPQSLRLTGTLKGERETDLAANVAGKVLEVKVERGQAVKKGDIIARIDVEAAALQLAEAKVTVETNKTQLEIDKRDCDRYEQLKARGAVSDLDYDSIMARCKKSPLSVSAAQARANTVAKNVGDGIIRAPFAGTIGDRFIEVGEYVQASSKVVSLAEVDQLRVEFSVPEADFPHVKESAPIVFHVPAFAERSFTGKVSYMGGAVRATRDILVEATVDNPDGVLLPGMFANIEVIYGEAELPSVPKSALFEQNGKWNILAVESGRLIQKVIQLGPEEGGFVAIRRGLEPGAQIVQTYKSDLKNGQGVE